MTQSLNGQEMEKTSSLKDKFKFQKEDSKTRRSVKIKSWFLRIILKNKVTSNTGDNICNEIIRCIITLFNLPKLIIWSKQPLSEVTDVTKPDQHKELVNSAIM